MWAMDLKDWLIVASTVAGPILAVQAQKAVERIRERRGRKLWIFHTLMGTRAARTAVEHVQALNMVDLAFYGARTFGVRHRSKREQAILDAWKEYHDHLNTPFDKKDAALWTTQGDELFVNLLHAIAQDVGFSFDRVQLKKGAYSPQAHGNFELEQAAIRKLLIDVLGGTRPMRMDVVNLPPVSAPQVELPAQPPRLPERAEGK